MTSEQVLKDLETQERLLQFSHFDGNDVWDLGNAIVTEAREREFSPAVSIRMNNGFVAFQYGFEGTGLDHEHWMDRKVRTTMVKQMSSLRAHMLLKTQNITLDDWFMPSSEYSTCGGAFPIRVRGVGMVGTVVASGISVALDHDLVIGGICRYLHEENVPRITDEQAVQ